MKEPIHREFTKFHYPVYWCYDILHALKILIPLGLEDSRLNESLDIVQRRRLRSGWWRAVGYFWKSPDPGRPPKSPSQVDYAGYEAVDWGRGGPNEMITLTALSVPKAPRRP